MAIEVQKFCGVRNLSSDQPAAAPPTFPISYIKTSGYREISCDGILGGGTGSGKLFFALYSDRYPIPRVTFHTTTQIPNSPDMFRIDEATPPIRIESREGIVRNVEVGAYLSLEVAERVHKWLGEQIIELKSGQARLAK